MEVYLKALKTYLTILGCTRKSKMTIEEVELALNWGFFKFFL